MFGLGSKAYPNFCAFARSLDKIIRELGGEPVLRMGEGDELCGQEESFKVWAKEVFQVVTSEFHRYLGERNQSFKILHLYKPVTHPQSANERGK